MPAPKVDHQPGTAWSRRGWVAGGVGGPAHRCGLPVSALGPPTETGPSPGHTDGRRAGQARIRILRLAQVIVRVRRWRNLAASQLGPDGWPPRIGTDSFRNYATSLANAVPELLRFLRTMFAKRLEGHANTRLRAAPFSGSSCSAWNLRGTVTRGAPFAPGRRIAARGSACPRQALR